MRSPRSSKNKIRVLVADREGIFRLGLKRLFALEDDLRVIAEADSGAQLLTRTETFRPDIVFVQEEILAESNTNLISELRRISPASKVVATASVAVEETSMRHVRSGAAGVILKSVDPPCSSSAPAASAMEKPGYRSGRSPAWPDCWRRTRRNPHARSIP